jgi:hypothetical protein
MLDIYYSSFAYTSPSRTQTDFDGGNNRAFGGIALDGIVEDYASTRIAV